MTQPISQSFAVATDVELDREGIQFRFQNSYARLPERFYARVHPTPVAAPRLVKLNEALARELGLDPAMLRSERGVEVLAGNSLAEGAEPLALAYAGHQFGHYVPVLGDGRANLLGEVLNADGVRYDIQLKGSGPTPFSRRGDGRSALGPVLREYLVSEWMAAVGVPTTRALAAITTGESVYREAVLPGAVLTRVAASHLRVGTFQYFTARGDVDGTRALANYSMSRHYPEATRAERPYQALLDGIIERQATLVAQWMLLGFVHGVMNTDNTSISGETIDYGPCAFMEAYHRATVFSSIDHQGRYAYGNQPLAMQWNLARLAEALLPLLEEEWGSEDAAIEAAQKSLEAFEKHYAVARLAGFRRKLGLSTEHEGDAELIESLLNVMAINQADFTLTFRALYEVVTGAETNAHPLFADRSAYEAWAAKWRSRLQEDSQSNESRATLMKRSNPAFIPRNHLVEAALKAAVEWADFAPFEELSQVLARPFEDQPGKERFQRPARLDEQVTKTFCGT